MDSGELLKDAIIKEVHLRLYEESLPRILKCLNQLNDAQIWWRPNESSNSIGNLVLHLCGNVQQWIYAGLGGNEDHRKRQTEFDERKVIPKVQLQDMLTGTMDLVKPVIENVTAADLLHIRRVQTFEETGLTILVHVTEHFSYHTGQIAYITKMLTDNPLGFYEGFVLE
jgi:uncharacterized damage-inducible protein DinB